MENMAEVITLNGKQYVLINKFIAIRVDALAEDYGRRFTAWKTMPDTIKPSILGPPVGRTPEQLSFDFGKKD